MLSVLQQMSGINFIILYVDNLSITEDHAIWFGLSVSLINFISTLSAVYLLRRIGRKVLLAYGFLSMCIWTSLLFKNEFVIRNFENDKVKDLMVSKALFSWFSMIFIALFVISFALTIGPLAWIFLTEIMTEKGMGIATSLNWVIIMFITIVPIFGNTNQDQYNYSWLFFTWSGFWMFGFILIIVFVKETRGLSLTKIRDLYKNSEYDPLVTKDNPSYWSEIE